MPKPRQGESKNKYIGRCMSQLVGSEGKEQKQSAAICYNYWDKKGSLSESTSLAVAAGLWCLTHN